MPLRPCAVAYLPIWGGLGRWSVTEARELEDRAAGSSSSRRLPDDGLEGLSVRRLSGSASPTSAHGSPLRNRELGGVSHRGRPTRPPTPSPSWPSFWASPERRTRASVDRLIAAGLLEWSDGRHRLPRSAGRNLPAQQEPRRAACPTRSAEAAVPSPSLAASSDSSPLGPGLPSSPPSWGSCSAASPDDVGWIPRLGTGQGLLDRTQSSASACVRSRPLGSNSSTWHGSSPIRPTSATENRHGRAFRIDLAWAAPSLF